MEGKRWVGCESWRFDGRREERYAPVDQMRRSSRGVCGNQADEHKQLTAGYGQVSAMLWTLMTKWETY